MRYYLDTSALIKVLLLEVGSDIVVPAMSSATQLLTCRVAYPEMRATLAGAVRSRRISSDQGHLVREVLDRTLWPVLAVVEVTVDLAASAGDLAERHELRGFDAVHLAAALEVGGDELVVVSWDGRLWDAARAEGVATLPAQRPGG